LASARFQIAQNEVKSISNPARITAIGGNNATEFYLNFPFLPPGMDVVFPFTYGFMFPIDAPTYQPVKVDGSTPPDGFPVAPTTTKTAKLVAYDTEQIFNPGVAAPTSSQLPSPVFFQSAVGIGATAILIAAVAGKTITLYDLYTMFDAVSATPAGGFQFQDTTPTSFAVVSCGIVNPPPLHFGPQGCKLAIGKGIQMLNNSGGAVTTRGCIVYSQG